MANAGDDRSVPAYRIWKPEKELFRESLTIRQRQLGAGHAEVLETRRHLAAVER